MEITFKPGQTNTINVIEGGTAEFTAKDGTKQTAELKKGMVIIMPSESLAVKNTGKTTLKAMLVEVSRSNK